MNANRINTEALFCRQGLARELEQHALEDDGHRLSKIKKRGINPRWNYCFSSPGDGLVIATVSPMSPTLKRAKRRTEMFSPSLPTADAINWPTLMLCSLMKGC